MPVPIRPVHQIEENMPSVFVDGGFSAMGLSDLQIKMLGLADIEQEAAKKIMVDSRDAEILHEIWATQNETELSKYADLQEIKMHIPEEINERDIIRMKTNGLIVGPDNEVSLTSKGAKVLKDKILASPSKDFLNRKKEKYEFEKESSNNKLIIVSELK